MSAAKVLQLDDYRDRRLHRLNLMDALYSVDASRLEIFRHLVEVAELSGADRVATVWVDEYGPGLVHPYVVLDLLSDRPRSSFPAEPLHKAWEIGIPGAHDDGMQAGSTGPSTFAVALGSDGARAWFLVAEAASPRPSLHQDKRDRLMFLAGECSAVALHRDLDTKQDGEVDGSDDARFAGWPILKDLEGREDDEAVGRQIAQRFVVARLIRMLLDEDLTVPRERVTEQVRSARAELAHGHGLDGREYRLWVRVLDSYEAHDLDLLGRTLITLGEMAEARDHLHGSLELYLCAYQITAAIAAPEAAGEAARYRARVLRRRALWDDAHSWYDAAHAIASAARLDLLAANALAGIALIKKDRGNLPAAREFYAKALAMAQKSGDRDTIATVHAGLLGLNRVAGDLPAALAHGWLAVEVSESDVAKTRCLATLAGALGEYGDREAAEDAWAIVARTSDEQYYRIYAHDALAHLAALRGDGDAFDAQVKLCDELDWESGPRSAKAEILYFRGLGCRALGRLDIAQAWLERAVAFAEQYSFNQILFDAEGALETLASPVDERNTPAPAAPPAVRDGVRAMREGLVRA